MALIGFSKVSRYIERVMFWSVPLLVLCAVLLLSACGGRGSANQASIDKAPVELVNLRTNIEIAGVDYKPILDELDLSTYWIATSEPTEPMLSALNTQLASLSDIFAKQFSLETFAMGIQLDPLQEQAIIIDVSASKLGQSRLIVTLAGSLPDEELSQPLAAGIYLALRRAHQADTDLLEKLVSHGLALNFVESELKPKVLYQDVQISTPALNDAIELAKKALKSGDDLKAWFDPVTHDFIDNGTGLKLAYYLTSQHFNRYPGSSAANTFSLDADLFSVNLAAPVKLSHKSAQYVRTSDVADQVGVSELTRQASDFLGSYFLEGWNQEKLIALTFDDGPSSYTTQILDILSQRKVKASFFWMGLNMQTNQPIMERALSEGHTLANHSWNHPHGRELSDQQLWQEQVLKTNELFQDSLGITPRFYRPPYGEISDEQIAFLDEKGMKVILWSVDTRDWNSPIVTSKNISDVMINNHHPEVINLMHDAGGDRQSTVNSLPKIIDYYRSQGYRFVNLQEMLGISDRS